MRRLESAPFVPTQNHQYVNEYVADKIERDLEKSIARTFPGHGLFGSDKIAPESEFEWICDYIDGAYSYSKKYKISVTSIALTYRGESIVCAVYNPWTDQLYSASKDKGAYLNERLLSPVPIDIEEGTLIDVEWWPWALYDLDSWLHEYSLASHVYVLHIGSIIHAACLVAEGVFGGAALAKYMKGKNHEIAAAKLLIEESGGLITDLFGNSLDGDPKEVHGLMIGSRRSHPKLIKSYEQFRKQYGHN